MKNECPTLGGSCFDHGGHFALVRDENSHSAEGWVCLGHDLIWEPGLLARAFTALRHLPDHRERRALLTNYVVNPDTIPGSFPGWPPGDGSSRGPTVPEVSQELLHLEARALANTALEALQSLLVFALCASLLATHLTGSLFDLASFAYPPWRRRREERKRWPLGSYRVVRNSTGASFRPDRCV